jgi:hypothetical protein
MTRAGSGEPVAVDSDREQRVHVDHPPSSRILSTSASVARNVYGP